MERFIHNLNVFVPCVIIGAGTIGGPIAALLSMALGLVAGTEKRFGYMGSALPFGSYLVVAIPMAIFWWRIGLLPAKRNVGRERRYKTGHLVLASTSVLTISTMAVPLGLAKITGNTDIALYAWLSLPVYMLAWILWPIGLFMVWSSRA